MVDNRTQIKSTMKTQSERQSEGMKGFTFGMIGLIIMLILALSSCKVESRRPETHHWKHLINRQWESPPQKRVEIPVPHF